MQIVYQKTKQDHNSTTVWIRMIVYCQIVIKIKSYKQIKNYKGVEAFSLSIKYGNNVLAKNTVI